MNKSEFIAAVAEKMKAKKADASKAVDAVLETVRETLKDEGVLRLIGFGTFKVTQVSEKMVRNPQNGELVKVPSSKRPKFVPGKELKEAVNNR